jgi:glycosyltransferase involved in cell wall biosynthesis
MIKVLGLSLYGPQAASARVRLMQYVPGLSQHGIELDIRPLLGDDYIRKTFGGESYPPWNLFRDYLDRAGVLLCQRGYDIALLHAELFPLLPGPIESRLLKIPYIYDFDDAFFLKYKDSRFGYFSFLLENKFKSIISGAAAVTAGNRFLFDYAKHLNLETRLVPTVVDTNRYTHTPNKRDAVFTIGWIGSPSTSVYLSELIQPLADLAQEAPIRFVVIGGRCPAIKRVDVVHLPWGEDTEVQYINTFDVGVMPLFNNEWAKGKCAFKLIQYMACAVPVVASPVGANLDVVDVGCGFFADNPERWRCSLRQLRDDLSLRRSMGEIGRKRVEALYSLHSALPTMVNTIKLVAAKGSCKTGAS